MRSGRLWSSAGRDGPLAAIPNGYGEGPGDRIARAWVAESGGQRVTTSLPFIMAEWPGKEQ